MDKSKYINEKLILKFYLKTKIMLNKLLPLNFQYPPAGGRSTIYKYAKIEKFHCQTTLILTKSANETWYDYFDSIKENGKIYVDCKLTVDIIENLIQNAELNEMTLRICPFEKRDDQLYLSSDIQHKTVLAYYREFHPGIWIYPDSNKYFGLYFDGIRSESIDFWKEFVDNQYGMNDYIYLSPKNTSLFSAYKNNDDILICSKPYSNCISFEAFDNSIIIHIDGYPITFDIKNIGYSLMKYISDNNNLDVIDVSWTVKKYNFKIFYNDPYNIKLNKQIYYIMFEITFQGDLDDLRFDYPELINLLQY